jgi:protein TonB
MSFGSPSTSPTAPAQRQALNLALPQTDAQAVAGPQLTVKGDIGADWMSELNDWVNAHKYYPAAAAAQNQQGSVQIEFTVNRQGKVTGLHMLSSSGYNFLDLAWLGMFQGVTLPPFPHGTKSDQITIDATMQYELVNPTP